MGPYTREIYERIMVPMIARGVIECWHWPALHRLEYRARSLAK